MKCFQRFISNINRRERNTFQKTRTLTERKENPLVFRQLVGIQRNAWISLIGNQNNRAFILVNEH